MGDKNRKIAEIADDIDDVKRTVDELTIEQSPVGTTETVARVQTALDAAQFAIDRLLEAQEKQNEQ